MRKIAALAASLLLASCALIIGLDAVPYGDVADAADAADASADAPAETSRVDAGCDTACGASRCCDPTATCLDADAGACSNDALVVSAGGNHACVVLADHSVWCWGENSVGQLGVDGGESCGFNDNGTLGQVPCSHVARKVEGLEARTVAAGFQFTCAATFATGEVVCWGDNNSSNLGTLAASSPSCTNAAQGMAATHCQSERVQVQGLSDVVALTASQKYACAATRTGDVSCWGDNTNSELGSGVAQLFSVVPVRVGSVPPSSELASVALNSWTCARTTDAGAWCWGAGIAGTESEVPHAVRSDTPLGNVEEIRAGNGTACVRLTNGKVACWGVNTEGELGQTNCGATTALQFVADVPFATQLDGRWNHSCALDSKGDVWCWGSSQIGAVSGSRAGNLTCANGVPAASPAKVLGLPRVRAIATGIQTSFAIDVDGKVWGWGDNDIGRTGHDPAKHGDTANCGDKNYTSTCNPTPVRVEGLP